MLQSFQLTEWNQNLSDAIKQQAINSLEHGQILYFPDLAFALTPDETYFLSPEHADPDAKNISYYAKDQKLWGVQRLTDEQRKQLIAMLDRFSRYATQLIKNLFPRYQQQLITARTSFRPVQISGRKTSPRKDDKRLHIDAFPSAPNQGQRILRVFSNINPHGEDRVWRVGEPFERVAHRFLPTIQKPFPGKSALLRFLRITKSYRTLYDHYMLQIHDKMKADDRYQHEVQQQEIRFPANTSWIVQTDHISHAVLQGQYLLEQTFYLPIEAMQEEKLSPVRILEKMLAEQLV